MLLMLLLDLVRYPPMRCLSRIPISLTIASPVLLQRDLPSLPSVTNYRANGLGHALIVFGMLTVCQSCRESITCDASCLLNASMLEY